MNRVPQILLAEDEDHIAKLISFKLNKEGYQVTVARNGEEAIALLPSRAWSLIILDVMMPIRDGWEVLREVRKSELKAAGTAHEVPVLMLTAKTEQQVIGAAAQLGATECMRKPFEPNSLAATVRALLEAIQ